MDFIEYQDFATVDATSSTTSDSLPTPVKRLNLSSIDGNDTVKFSKSEFKLPNLSSTKDSDETNVNATLYDKMAQYANLSIERMNNGVVDLGRESFDNNANELQIPASNLDATTAVLSKKLSKVLNDYNLNNYQSTLKLRKALDLLEKNKKNSSFNSEALVTSEYIGSLARKILRSDLENELLKEHITTLEEFRPIIRRIKRLATSIEKIKEETSYIIKDQDKIEGKAVNRAILQDVSDLQSQMKSLGLKKQLLTSVKEKFTLTQVEDDIITNGSINNEFFIVANKVLNIRENATYLLALPNSNAGQALISKVNELLTIINRKFFNFLTDFLYSFESNSVLSSNENKDEDLILFQKSLLYLSNDLEYFNEFIKKTTAMRSKLILDEFLSQFDLNKLSVSNGSKPIILSAHDPIRYIGDVLATIHSLIANEADFIKSLFKFQYQEFDNTPKSILTQNENEFFLEGLDIKVLNMVVSSLANSARIRIEQIVRFEENFKINFEVAQLLKLYQLMFIRKNIKDDSALITNLKNLQNISNDKLLDFFTKYIEQKIKTVNYQESGNDDLLPPDWLNEYLNYVVELFELYERNTKEEDSISLDVLNKIITEPCNKILLEQLQKVFPLAKKNESARLSLLTIEINCFDLIKSRLKPFVSAIFTKNEEDETHSKYQIYKAMDDKLNTFINDMTNLQTKILFEKTGLDMYNNLLNMIFPIKSVQDELDYDMYFSLNENQLMALENITKNITEKLNEYVPIALTDVQENLLFKLTSPSIADQICSSSFNELSIFYRIFRKVLAHLNPDNVDEINSNILNFSEEEFDTLIGIE
ncbi:hypothetical protein KAFR_0H03390 [Kazachstania africana CBS 2517]|uniref:Conserved oligomeric Golgi complex subunit 6 n=1 Tax=Kazachstania africana (strain ATCC 22294 / BCRC 22015 / CBS 2517 / CECT 1963 / NBRC 1671 / NRRL Y-8276) TaxID=1071382 RepID=H2AYH2_KAZAF|nr:hypothetical protein KAFR_0H03390 [Kazachstania africana CBS 2517]CCF59749.1 hypothetical protein KAFR_0H03390 [Kazachstania africana CBS 2517]